MTGQPLQVLRSRLLASDLVDDVHLVRRDSEELLAYVVPKGAFAESKLRELVDQRVVFCPVTALPIAADGRVDEAKLAAMPIADETVRRQAEETIRAELGVIEARVVFEESRSPRPPLIHAFDLWPERAQIAETPRAVAAATVADPSKPPAIARGGDPLDPPGAPQTLPALLRLAAQAATASRLTFIRPGHEPLVQTYAELLAQAERIHGGLVGLGLRAGDELILALDRPEDVLPAFWGAVLGGFVPAIAEPPRTGAAAVDRIAAELSLFDLPLVVAARADLAGGTLARQLSDRSGRNVRAAAIEDLRAHPHLAAKHRPKPEDTAFLCLTSGSTGVAKCVMLTHRAILTRARGASAAMRSNATEIALGWLPFDHIGTISDWHLRVVELGASAVYAPKEYVLGRPLAWLDLIDRHRVTGTWAPDFAYRMLAEELDRAPGARWDLSSVRTMLTAGETVIARATENLLGRLERHGLARSALQPAFGMAELGSGITYQDRPLVTHESGGGVFVELGPPIPGCSLRIAGDDGRPLSEGAVGRLQVSGAVVAPGYYKNPEATKAVFLADGWFDTGDLGFLIGGRLVLTGRAKETLIINGANYHPHEIEAAVEGVRGVHAGQTAACAVRRAAGILPAPERGPEKLAVFYSAEATVSPREIKKTVAAKVGVTPDWLVPIGKEEIPRTAIGKIRRAELVRDLERGRFDDRLKQTDFALESASTMPNWFFRPSWQRREAAGFEERAAQIFRPHPADSEAHLALLELLRSGPKELTVAVTPRHAALAGLVRAARAELAGARLRFVELEDEHTLESGALEKPGDVAYRGGRRYVRALEPVELSQKPILAPAFVEGGHYLLSGGRGGIGSELAKYLTEVKRAQVSIIARGAPEPIEVTDPIAVRDAVERWEQKLGRTIDGIIHLAGEFHEARLDAEDAAGLKRALHAKVEGARALGALLESRPKTTLVAFSSLAGFFGGAGLGAYSMASLELERVIDELRSRTGGRASWFAFSSWSGVGMSRNVAGEFLLAAKGYFPISVERGIASLEAALARGEHGLAIGLDGSHPEIRKLIAAEASPRRELVAFVRGESKPRITVRARYGAPIECEVRPLERAGEEPVERAPRTETEKKLAQFWIELLDVTSVSATANFFALGGHSLVATQLISRIRESFGVELDMARLFETPTVEGIGAAIDARGAASATAPVDPQLVDSLVAEMSQLSTADLERIVAEDVGPGDDAAFEDERASRKLELVCLITGNRPAAAERALESYIANFRAFGRDPEIAVFDDTVDRDLHQAYLERLRALKKRTGARISCAWIDDKDRHARRIAELGAVPYEVLQSAIFRVKPFNYGCGSNRNNALLHTPGEKYFCIDDDTLARPVAPPVEREGWAIASGVDPAEYWFFDDRERALAAPKYVERDLLGAHEALLGRAPPASEVAAADVSRAGAVISERARDPRARIAMTICGLAGDCGWNVPFGRWAAPMGYLLHDPRSHRRLVAGEASYHAACLSRQILRIVDRPTLADDANTMSTFLGIDNTALMPPLVPTQRGADLIQGVTLWTAQDRDLIAHLPLGLVHVPVDRRVFWPGEVVRSASGFDSARLFIQLIRMFTPPRVEDRGARYRALGKHLFELGSLPAGEFAELVERETRRWNEIFLGELRARLREYSDAPEYWRNDVERYAELLEKSMSDPDYLLPLDIFSALQDRELTRATTQRRVRNYGAILIHWPDVIEAAALLRKRGEVLAKPI